MMTSRRTILDMGLPPVLASPVSLPEVQNAGGGWEVLGIDLNRSESGRLFSVFDFQDFSSLFGKPCSRFANRCSGFSHGGLGQSTLVGSLGVARKLGKAGVASDRSDLVRGAASPGQTS